MVLIKIIIPTIISDLVNLLILKKSKKNYLIDHYIVDYHCFPDITVKKLVIGFNYFHIKRQVWKGSLTLVLNTPKIYLLVLNYLKIMNC